MAIYNIDSEGHNREFDLSYSSDEPTIGGGKGGSTEPLICNGTFDTESGKLTLDKTANDIYEARCDGRTIILLQEIMGEHIESIPSVSIVVRKNDNKGDTFDFYVAANSNTAFEGSNLAPDDPVVLTSVS